MACATPNYAEGDVPPSYSEVIKSIEAATGNNTMPQQLLHVIEGLSAPERKVLSDIAQTRPPKMTDEEKKKSAINMAKGLSAPEGQELLKGTAKDVARAASSVKGGFQSLKLKLSELENTAKSNFLSKLQTHEQTFDFIVKESRLLAINISQYGEKFDTLVVPLTSDKKLTVERRLKKINEHIEEAKGFQSDADAMQTRFATLMNDFTLFVGDFANWAKSHEEGLDQKIADLNEEIAELQALLSRLEKSMYGMGAGVVVGGLLMRFASLTGPAAPFVTGLGAVIGGVSAIALIGLGVQFSETKGKIERKQSERDELTKEKKTIIASREELKKLGKEQLSDLHKNLDFLASYWKDTDSDTRRIQKWLEAGANDADLPEYMKISIDGSVTIYKTMATYLKAYADGLPSV